MMEQCYVSVLSPKYCLGRSTLYFCPRLLLCVIREKLKRRYCVFVCWCMNPGGHLALSLSKHFGYHTVVPAMFGILSDPIRVTIHISLLMVIKRRIKIKQFRGL